MYKLFDSKVAEIASCVHRYVLPFIQLENEWFVYRYVHQLRRRKRRKKKNVSILRRWIGPMMVIASSVLHYARKRIDFSPNVKTWMENWFVCWRSHTHTRSISSKYLSEECAFHWWIVRKRLSSMLFFFYSSLLFIQIDWISKLHWNTWNWFWWM